MSLTGEKACALLIRHRPRAHAKYIKAIDEGFFKDSEFGWSGEKLGDRPIRLLYSHGVNAFHVRDFDSTGRSFFQPSCL